MEFLFDICIAHTVNISHNSKDSVKKSDFVSQKDNPELSDVFT